MTTALVILAIVAMVAAAVNSGFEVGVYSLSRVRLRYRLLRGLRGARALDELLKRPERLISGILVAQNAAVFFVTATVTSTLEHSGVPWARGCSTLALSVVFFIFVEAVPKNVFRHAADVLVYPLAPFYRWLLAVLAPAVTLLRAVSRFVIRLGSSGDEAFESVFTRERLAFYMREGESEGILSQYQVELTQNILRGEKVTVARAMVPLEEVAAVGEDICAGEFMSFAAEHGFSRYPVYGADRENITAVLNIYDCRVVESTEEDLRRFMRAPVVFRGDTHVIEAIKALRESRQGIGVVVEGSKARGIVTLKDCVEEIVGELYEW